MKKRIVIYSLLLISFSSFGQSTIQIDVVNGTQQVEDAAAYCSNIWSAYLNSSVPIKITLYYVNLSGSTLGITIPNGRYNFPGALIDSVWYPTTLANALSGTELNPNEDDMNVFIDNTVAWYFGLDGNTPYNKYDFVSVLMHEIAHGLGFMALSKIENGEGSFGYITPTDLAPLVFSFPFPDLAGRYAVYSTFIENQAGELLSDSHTFHNPSTELAAQFTSNQLYFNGSLAKLANNNQRVRLFAPANFEFGSSLHHLNESTYPPNNPNTMMTPYISAGESQHHPGPVAIAILQDLGWSVNADVSLENEMGVHSIKIFPNPAVSSIHIYADQYLANETIEIFNMQGQRLLSQAFSEQLYLSLADWADGVYLIYYKGRSQKFIKVSNPN